MAYGDPDAPEDHERPGKRERDREKQREQRDDRDKKKKKDGPFDDVLTKEDEGEVDPHTEMNFGNESVIMGEFDLLQNLINTRRKDKGRNILLQGQEDPLAKLILLGGSA